MKITQLIPKQFRLLTLLLLLAISATIAEHVGSAIQEREAELSFLQELSIYGITSTTSLDPLVLH